jgi:hypothetical protein
VTSHKTRVNQYNLDQKATEDGSIYIEVGKGMYGLSQAGLLDQNNSLKI